MKSSRSVIKGTQTYYLKKISPHVFKYSVDLLKILIQHSLICRREYNA